MSAAGDPDRDDGAAAPHAPPATAHVPPATDARDVPPATDARRRPLVERVGMAAIALALAALFGAVAVAAFAGGEPSLGIMGAIGALMTLWVGALTLLRG